MSFLTLIVTAIGLAADAFAVAVGRGMRWPHFAWRPALAIALTFGAFQALMPVVGWALGSAFAGAIATFDHWVAFGLLAAIGGKMMWEARGDFRPADAGTRGDQPAGRDAGAALAEDVSAVAMRPRVRTGELLLLGIATSVDALAIGVSFALLDVSIAMAAVLIGVVTAALSLGGVAIGHHAGRHLKAYAELLGGAVLIGIGIKILLDHLGA